MDRPKSIAGLFVIILFMLAEVPVSLGAWVSVGNAPEEAGVYNVVIQATYNGVTGTFPLQLIVGQVEYSATGLSIEPVYPIDKTTPIELRYDIKINGSRDFDMVNNSLTVYYASGNTVLSSETSALSLENDSYWHATVDVPFKGEYRAVITLLMNKNGRYYGGRFVTYFKSDTVSDRLRITQSVDKKVLIPSESFKAELEAAFEDYPLPDLTMFKTNLYGTVKRLNWDRGEYKYRGSLIAPSIEGIYLLSFYADGQDYVTQQKVYVADISKAKAGKCSLSAGASVGSGSCTDMKDVRKCVSDYKSGLLQVSQDALASCFESASGGIIQGSVICSDQKGDLDGDEQLDVDDIDTLQNMILPLSQSARQDYLKCADYDNSGKVDEADLQCLTNVVAGKWDGDFSGGVCFDATYDSPLKCDLNGDQFIRQDDVKLFGKLLNASNDGIEMSPRALYACDFDEDGRITQEDKRCLNYFVGMDLDKPETLLAGGQTIPSSCMAIYDLNDCQRVPGDLNGDLVINEVDEILEMLVEKKQVTSYGMQCADVNKDGRITLEDVACVKSYTAGNQKEYFVCIGCNENTPPAYRNIAEICGDGYDNDCDGLVDRTSMGANDLCSCQQNTPCWMVLDADGGVKAGVEDTNVKVCRKVEWAVSGAAPGTGATGGYKWYSPDELTCDKSRQCQTMLCAQTVYKCAHGTYGWKWYDIDEGLPVETDMPTDTPKTCGDGFDNDCNCGDQVCAKEESGSMFESPAFWVGLIGGAALGYFGNPMIVNLLSYGSTLGGFLTDDPELKSGLSGFGFGLALGNYAATPKGTGASSQGTSGSKPAGTGTGPLQGPTQSGATLDTVPSSPKFSLWKSETPLGNSISNAFSGGLFGGTSTPALGNLLASRGAAMIGMAAGGIGLMMASSNYAEKVKKWVHTTTCTSNT